jgi:RimJ/RimL family protein N-acetyltransferase/sugar phosphate isomerase/epimerase
MQFKRVNIANTSLLQNFIDRAGKSLETFRYFAKRPFSIVANHACTWVIEEDGNVEAYGHLDKEGDTVWLGIAVTDHARGKGYGRKMMERLMESASALGLQKVRLSVDNQNEAAIRLYERFGFKLAEKKETFGFYEWNAKPLKEAVISSLAFLGKPVDEIISICREHNFILEFSSGMPYRVDMEQIFLDAPVKRFAHNYFPAPEVPFVLNLASKDENIRSRSILHCINGMRLSYAVKAPFFSAHAGFCVDPKPDELGRELSKVASFDREMHWDLFLQSIREILELTADLPTGFLLENNVLAKMNVYASGANPLLCVESAEMLKMLEEISDPRAGILLDTAHLKVSSKTLDFDLNKAAEEILPQARCIHHSDNDGLHDNNQPFDGGYWFLPFMKKTEHSVHVLEVRKQDAGALKNLEKLLYPV